MENDDVQVGRVLTRREAIMVMGAASASLLAGCSTGQSASEANGQTPAAAKGQTATVAAATPPGCIVRPEETAGPYYVDEKLNRSDIRSDPTDRSIKPGTPLELTFNVTKMTQTGCIPLAGAVVDVWHCDALGVYSDVRDQNGYFDTKGKKFLRGYQVTDAAGHATFKTIYPGWYEGRTVHIHFTIRSSPGAASGHEFTSQVYFNDSDNDRILSEQPYKSKGLRKSNNASDGIFRENGSQLILALRPATAGYVSTFDIALQTA